MITEGVTGETLAFLKWTSCKKSGAILHYGHTTTLNGKTSKDGDATLFDMGAIYHFRGSQHCNIYNEA